MKMKKIICLTAVAVLAFNIAACGTTQTGSTDSSSIGSGTATGNIENVSSDSSEVKELEYPKTDVTFETKAEITLGTSVTIEGSGVTVSEENVISITEGGEYIFTGTLSEGMIYVDTEDAVEITLNGVSITNDDGPAIFGENSDAIYINTVSGTENILTDGSTYATDEDGSAIGKGTIFSNDDLYFVGEGTLTVIGNYKHAVKSDDSIFVESGTIILNATKDGMNANDTLMMDGGSVTVESGIEGLEGTYVVINDGTVNVTVSDDGLNSGTELQINGGNLYVSVTGGDALDSNGSLSISGGTMVLHGAASPECGIDCDSNSVLITGGTVIATGGGNSTPDADNDTQYAVLLGSANAGDTIGILDEDGNTIFAYETDVSYSNLLVSIDGIEEGATYSVYVSGTITAGTDFYGYYAGGVYEGGTESQTFTADSLVISAGGTVGEMGGGGRGGMKNDGNMPGNGTKLPEA